MRIESDLLVSKRAPVPLVECDIIVLLKQEHAALHGLLTQFEKAAKANNIKCRFQVSDALCTEFTELAAARDFYPAEATTDEGDGTRIRR